MTSDVTPLGFSVSRLSRIETFLRDKYVDSGRLPGAQVTVLRHGELAYRATIGQADTERGRKLEDDTIFRIYSMTKPITSIAFMMLVEEGKVALDDPVTRFIPEWKDLGVLQAGGLEMGGWLTKPLERPMQIVDLLRHTSGLTYGFQHRGNLDQAYRKLHTSEFNNEGGLDGMIADLAKLPLLFSPGEAWNYSVSTDVLGYLIGRISGMPLQDFLQARIFDPLGMADTGFFVAPGKAHRLPACYTQTPRGRELLDDPETSLCLKPPALYSGGGGLLSTSNDYLRFCRMLLGRGSLDGEQLIAPKTLSLMTANHLPGGKDLTEMSVSLFSEATFAGVGFGLGFAVTEKPALTLLPVSKGEFFWGGMASTAFWIDPVEDLACVFMTQLTPSSTYPLRREMRTLIYGALVDSQA
ncbi:serine hydrolase domain-containing protein [soil metagenome]